MAADFERSVETQPQRRVLCTGLHTLLPCSAGTTRGPPPSPATRPERLTGNKTMGTPREEPPLFHSTPVAAPGPSLQPSRCRPRRVSAAGGGTGGKGRAASSVPGPRVLGAAGAARPVRGMAAGPSAPLLAALLLLLAAGRPALAGRGCRHVAGSRRAPGRPAGRWLRGREALGAAPAGGEPPWRGAPRVEARAGAAAGRAPGTAPECEACGGSSRAYLAVGVQKWLCFRQQQLVGARGRCFCKGEAEPVS